MARTAKKTVTGRRGRSKQRIAARIPAASTKLTIAKPQERPWMLTQEEVTIVKNSIAKGASDQELKFCLTVARRYKLDPFKKQIWFVKRWDKEADNGNGGKGAHVWVPQVGIDGLLFTSNRDHKAEFGSVSLPEFGPMVLLEGHGKLKAPEWARVKVWKRGMSQPTEAEAWWTEYAPADLDKAPFWKKMPRRMLGKCATALALRQAYPDLGGLYIPEELEKMAEDYTESGRQITEGPVVGTLEAAQEAGRRQAKAAEERIAARLSAPTKIVSVRIPSDGSEVAYVSGDLDERIVTEIKERCEGIKLEDKDIYVIPVLNIEVLQQRCKMHGYGYQEVSALPSPNQQGASDPKPTTQAAESAVATPSEQLAPSLGPDGATAFSGVFKSVKKDQISPKSKAHYWAVLIDETWLYAYRSTLWPIFEQIKKGTKIDVWVKDKMIRGFKKVGNREFENDGATPIIQRNEDRPKPGKLFE